MNISLPTERSPIDKRWRSQKFGIIGPAGIGKSKFFSFDDRNLYIQTEAGLNHLSVKKIPCKSWEEYKAIEIALFQSYAKGNFPYEDGTIVIDTCDRFKDLADEEAMQIGRNKFKSIEINTIGDIPNGAGWSWSTALVMGALQKLEELPCAIAFIGHLESKEVKEPTRSVHKQTISIGGKCGLELCAWTDHLLNITAAYSGAEIKRQVRTRPTATIEAKSREGMIADGWIWSSNDKENWDKLRGLFN